MLINNLIYKQIIWQKWGNLEVKSKNGYERAETLHTIFCKLFKLCI